MFKIQLKSSCLESYSCHYALLASARGFDHKDHEKGLLGPKWLANPAKGRPQRDFVPHFHPDFNFSMFTLPLPDPANNRDIY